MSRRNALGFHLPGRHCLHQARIAVMCSASRMTSELHPTKNWLWGGSAEEWGVRREVGPSHFVYEPSHSLTCVPGVGPGAFYPEKMMQEAPRVIRLQPIAAFVWHSLQYSGGPSINAGRVVLVVRYSAYEIALHT